MEVESSPLQQLEPYQPVRPAQHCQTRRRIYYVVIGLSAAVATLLNWTLMQTKGFSVPALAVLTSLIAWIFLLGCAAAPELQVAPGCRHHRSRISPDHGPADFYVGAHAQRCDGVRYLLVARHAVGDLIDPAKWVIGRAATS